MRRNHQRKKKADAQRICLIANYSAVLVPEVLSQSEVPFPPSDNRTRLNVDTGRLERCETCNPGSKPAPSPILVIPCDGPATLIVGN